MNISANITKYLYKGVGLATLGMVAYDSHVMGKLQADVTAKSADADACYDTFNNTQYLTSPSPTVAKMKEGVHHFELNSNYRSFFNSAYGYFKGGLSTAVSNVIPLAGGIGALFGKGKVAKYSAIGLGAYGLFVLAKDVFGFGHYNDLNKPY